jgi:hypothetical protein
LGADIYDDYTHGCDLPSRGVQTPFLSAGQNMKVSPYPFFVPPAGAALLMGLVCLSAQAQSTGSATLASIANPGVASDMLTVDYAVSYTSGPNSSYYTYDYTIYNPGTSGALVETFNLAFDASQPGAVYDLTGGAQNDGNAGITWDVSVLPGQNSETLLFESDFGPTMNNANAGGGNEDGGISAPWASDPGGQQVSVPNVAVVPEPATTTLIMLSLLLLPFGSHIFKRRRPLS